MASILANQDQENVVYGRQQAAASKPLNQLRPKTPRNKLGKLAPNDENVAKTQGKTISRPIGNENLLLHGKKGARQEPITPTAAKNRAPLGAKTTNAKAKPFNTLVLQGKETDKLKNGSAARRKQIKVVESHTSTVDLLQDADDIPDIEYMPPKAQDLPDIPEELENGINLSMFENGGMQRDFLKQMWLGEGADGRSALDRDQERAQLAQLKSDAEDELIAAYTLEIESIMCMHEPDCPTAECKDAPKKKLQAKERLDQRLAEIHKTERPPMYKTATKGPTTTTSRSAASALAMSRPKPSIERPKIKTQTSTFSSILPGTKSQNTNTSMATNPSSMRHTAAVVASNTTLGYGKGRAARANLRQGVLAPKDANMKSSGKSAISKSGRGTQDLNALSPAEYIRLHGEPKFLSEMWWRCKTAGLIKVPGEEDKKVDRADVNTALFKNADVEEFEREEAEKEFELVL